MDISKLPLLRQDSLLFKDTSRPPTPGTMAPCLICTKPYIVPKYIGEPDQVCPGCRQTYDDCARLVCVMCKAVIGRVDPGIIDNGYYIRPKSILHVDHCNTCRPGLKTSTVIEIAQWEKLMRPGKLIMLTPARVPKS